MRKIKWFLFLFITLLTTMCCIPISTQAAGKVKKLTVKVDGIVKNKKKVTMPISSTKKLKVIAKPVSSVKSVKYKSKNTSIVTVNSKGKVSSKKSGTAKINITVKGKKGKKTTWVKFKVEQSSAQVRYCFNNKEFATAVSKLVSNNTINMTNDQSTASSDEFYTGRLLIKEKINANLEDKLLSSECVQVCKYETAGLYVAQYKTSDGAKQMYSIMNSDNAIDWVEADSCTSASNEPMVSALGYSVESDGFKSWGVTAIGTDQYASKLNSVDGSITVAVVDTGVSKHEFLGNRRLSTGYDFVDNKQDAEDFHKHGTHVAGIIVDCTPNLPINILPVRVLGADGNGYSSVVANGVRYAVDEGTKVINLSLGGKHSDFMDEAIAYAINKGVTVIVSAGNNHGNTEAWCPAHLTGAIIVGAVDSSDQKASFSNVGSSVDIVAPGVDVTSCVPGGYASMSGTSMAAPHVSAIAAMYLLQDPSLTPASVEQMIKSNVRDLGPVGWDNNYGYGIPDLSNASINPPSVIPNPGGSNSENNTDQGSGTEPTGVKIDSIKEQISVGETIALSAIVYPSEALDQTVVWHSSNPNSVKVDSMGNLTGIAEGSATITATTVNGKEDSLYLRVVSKSGESTESNDIKITGSSSEVAIGETLALSVTVSPAGSSVSWQSSDSSIASINSNGIVTGIKSGNVVITASIAGGVKDTYTVSVKEKPASGNQGITGILLSGPESNQIAIGYSVVISAVIIPSTVGNGTLVWESSAPSIASVDSQGKVTGIKASDSIVTVTATASNGIKGTYSFIVYDPDSMVPPHPDEPDMSVSPAVTSITITGVPTMIQMDSTFRCGVTITPDGVEDKSIVWHSSNPAIASIDSNGNVITAKYVEGQKSVTITATASNGVSSSCTFIVHNPNIFDPPDDSSGSSVGDPSLDPPDDF